MTADLSGFDWLSEQIDQHSAPEAEIDVPGGDFLRGFVGEWEMSMMYKLYTPTTIDLDEEGVAIPYDYKVPTRNGNGIFWYWQQKKGAKEHAQEAARLADRRSPNRVWHWEMPISTLLGYAGEKPASEQFGDSISIDSEIYGLGSNRRTEYHLLFLPSFVQSLALLSGALADPIFAYADLLFDQDAVSEEYIARLVGPSKSTGDHEFEVGELWKARAALWKALGEDEPKLWTAPKRQRKLDKEGNPTGEWEEVPTDPKTDTAAPLLKACLQPTNLLEFKLWGQTVRVANPRLPTAKEIERDQKPFGISVVAQLWRSRDEAQAAIGGTEGEFPPLPAGWAGATPRDFHDWIKKYLADNYAGKPAPLVKQGLQKEAKTLQAQYAVSLDEMLPWVDFLLNGGA